MPVEMEHLVQMEMAVIGAVIDKPDEWAEEAFARLPLEQFGPRVYKVACAVYEMWSDHLPMSPVLVVEYLRKTGRLRSDHGPLIADCCAFAWATPSIPAYLDALTDLYLARRIHLVATRTQQLAHESDVLTALAYLSTETASMSEAAAVRTPQDNTTLADIIAMPVVEIDWLIPGLLPTADRLLVTATEGAGKSTLLRQFAMSLALGVHPFEPNDPIPPGRSLLIDCEVSRNQLLHSLQRMYHFGARHTHGGDPGSMAVESRAGGLDLCDPSDQAWLMRLVREHRPDMLALGPLYRLASGDINDEPSVRCWQRVLEPLLEQGITIVMEHHAPNASDTHGNRYLRPIGSSVIRRWVSQGVALRSLRCLIHDADFCASCPRRGVIEFWRGGREQTRWPTEVRAPRNDIWWLDASRPE